MPRRPELDRIQAACNAAGLSEETQAAIGFALTFAATVPDDVLDKFCRMVGPKGAELARRRVAHLHRITEGKERPMERHVCANLEGLPWMTAGTN